MRIQILGDARINAMKALAAVAFISCFWSLGSCMLRSIKEPWSFLDGFYFCFITMTTIGFGDMVPSKQDVLINNQQPFPPY